MPNWRCEFESHSKFIFFLYIAASLMVTNGSCERTQRYYADIQDKAVVTVVNK